MTKLKLFVVINIILASQASLAANAGVGRRERTRSEEELAAIIAESERTATEELKARDEYQRTMKAAMEASRGSAAVRAESPDSRALREALHASRISAAVEDKERAHKATVAGRKDVAIVARAESNHALSDWSNPSYIRTHIEELIKDDSAYRAIISTNLTIDEKIAREGEYAKGGGTLEPGYRRKKLERVIKKLEAASA